MCRKEKVKERAIPDTIKDNNRKRAIFGWGTGSYSKGMGNIFSFKVMKHLILRTQSGYPSLAWRKRVWIYIFFLFFPPLNWAAFADQTYMMDIMYSKHPRQKNFGIHLPSIELSSIQSRRITRFSVTQRDEKGADKKDLMKCISVFGE